MNYEKEYKEAIKRAKAVLEIAANKEEAEGYVSTIFPELKESEDERIRKHIIEVFRDHFNGEDCDKCIAWLEKQKTSEEALQYLRENHSPSEVSDFQAVMNIAVAKAYDKGYNDALKKQGEQKPVDVRTTGYWHVEDVEQKPDEEYNITGISSNKSQGKLGEIIKNLKTTWSEKDEVGLANAMWAIEQARTIAKDENDMGNLWYAERWLKSLKDRVGCEVNCTTTKEWSEEDESILQGIWDEILANKHQAKEYEWKTYDRFLSWLKSLRPQSHWKPSEHEITVLEKIQHGEINPSNPTLHRVIKCLKKLREE